MSHDGHDGSESAHTSVPPAVALLAVDPPTGAAIAETLSTERDRPWLGPLVALVVVVALIVAGMVFTGLAGGSGTPAGTPVPSF